ncbi:12-oxophytodienoate reductase [Mycobacterium sp. 852002-50816_SCH5313054-b]|uniref:oxidoreductase n=1 Tax=Mycobacterium sp. 852002-50816_SCH5313054-b TaxID=1834092 RepID=UPI0007FD02BF|nr:12-oxophytodienoate reductase [Mycobacterium sp. 852002-50816_SCH5313054-b]OBF46337.1 12-oxophytodienoate reductase [Mycobacterium sp. 852002-50816_SCH5313054-b]
MADDAVDISGLLTPLTVRSVRLPNRFALAPMTRYATPDGVPTAEYPGYFRRRAAGGMGLLITEATLIPDPSTALDLDMASYFRDEAKEVWRTVVEGVHDEGAAIFSQLLHAGVYRGPNPAVFPDVPAASPSGIDFYGEPVGKPLSTNDIDRIYGNYVRAARNAQWAGFDGIEVHGAHGYLPDLFLWGRTNRRDDRYGGALRDRTRFAAELITALRAELGPQTPISFRFSQWKADLYDARLVNSPHELEALLRPLAEAGVDILHPSTRRHYQPAFPERSGTDGQLSLAGWTKKVTGLPTIVVGSIGLTKTIEGQGNTPDGHADIASLQTLVEQFERGEFDIAAIGRAALANLDFVDKVRAGRDDELIPYNEHRHKLTLC